MDLTIILIILLLIFAYVTGGLIKIFMKKKAEKQMEEYRLFSETNQKDNHK